MLKNYWRIAFRNLTRNRFSSTINIGGLAIGMSVAILIGLWIYDELSYDRSTPHSDRIANVMQNRDFSGEIQTWWSTPMQLAPVLRKDYGSLFKHVVLDGGTSPHLLAYQEKRIKPTGDFIEPGVIDMLGLNMLKGNKDALADPSSLVLSASVARELFGSEDPIGKVVKMDNTYPLKVSGVYADLPRNSTWNSVQMIAAWDLLRKSQHYDSTLHWGNSWFQVYVQLNDHVEMAAASAAIRDIEKKYAPAKVGGTEPSFWLHAMSRWHLYSDFKNGFVDGGEIRFVRLYAIIGVFVLLLACINFMNLSTARSEKRAKEVGIRKAIGSVRGQLVRQFFSESLLVAAISFLTAIVIAQLLLPFFNEVAGKHMAIPYGQPLFWLAGIGFAGFTGLLAGSYPALYLSSFSPVKVLKGTFKVGRLAAMPRKALVVFQFTVSVVLIVGTIGVLHQIRYAKDRPVGYNREGLLTVPLQSLAIGNHWESLRSDLKATGMVAEIAGSESSAANTYITNSGFSWRGKNPTMQDQLITNGITPEYGRVSGWQVMEGRDFINEAKTDSNHVIINEKAAQYMGLQHPVGEVIQWGDNGKYTIVGVVRDMVSQSPYDQPRPMLFYLSAFMSWSKIGLVNLRLKPEAAMSPALAAIGNVFRKYDPEDLFEYHFVDEDYAKKFGDEERIGQLAGFFTILAILISCLGLLGLSAFVAEQRTREVGIRKVLGASVYNLWHLLSREFVVLVGLSLLIGGPVAYWIMHGWLSNYQYHASLSWWIFGAAAAGALGLTLLTVSFQAIRAALTNPVRSLRSE